MQHIFCIFAKNFYFANKLHIATLHVEGTYLMLGQIVRRIRKGHKKSLAEWAQVLNVSVSALSRLEKGQTGKVGETVGNIIRKIPDLTTGEKEMLQNALDFYYNKKKKEDSI
jgi:transcriptional regulator with XRE-family HTH domain